MAKHKRVWNENQYRKYLAEGRGQGLLDDYKPWIQIQDFPSQGIVSRVKGRKTGRVHHLMSNLELEYFYLLDWSEKTQDIREQYPLEDLTTAISIAETAGIRYPYDKASGFPYIMTSDFLITTRNGLAARAIKPIRELKKAQVREKLEIERRYWQHQGIDWKLVTENEIPRTKVRNIQWLCSGQDVCCLIPDDKQLCQCKEAFLELYDKGSYPIMVILQYVENDFGLGAGSGIAVFKMLVYEKQIILDLDKEINLAETKDGKAYGMRHLFE